MKKILTTFALLLVLIGESASAADNTYDVKVTSSDNIPDVFSIQLDISKSGGIIDQTTPTLSPEVIWHAKVVPCASADASDCWDISNDGDPTLTPPRPARVFTALYQCPFEGTPPACTAGSNLVSLTQGVETTIVTLKVKTATNSEVNLCGDPSNTDLNYGISLQAGVNDNVTQYSTRAGGKLTMGTSCVAPTGAGVNNIVYKTGNPRTPGYPNLPGTPKVAVDARRPYAAGDAPVYFDIIFEKSARGMFANDFTVTKIGGNPLLPVPGISLDLDPACHNDPACPDGNIKLRRVIFNTAPEVGSWIKLTYTGSPASPGSNDSVYWGTRPCDVDQDGKVTMSGGDWSILVAAANFTMPNNPYAMKYQADMDRNGTIDDADRVTMQQLLGGQNGYTSCLKNGSLPSLP